MSRAGRGWGMLIVVGSLCGCGGKSDPPPAKVPPADPPVAVGARAPELRFEGRFDDRDPGGPRFQWPGSAVVLRFTGTSVKVTLGERSLETDEYGKVAHNWYDVWIDDRLAAPVQAAEGIQTYLLADGLSPGEHQVVLRKRTEAYVGEGQLLGFELEHGATVLPAAPPTRRIEFIGDSITAGFGVDGPDEKCLFSAETQNYSNTFAALTARAFGAEQIALAATGAGVSRNWGNTTENTIGAMYDRILPTDYRHRWDFARWKPDVVVLNLGTNDFATGDPGGEKFIAAYRALIAQVRQNYPSALIVIGLGPMLSDLWPQGAQALTKARTYVSSLVSDINNAGDARVKLLEFPNQDRAASFGCKFHPSVATHRQMAEQLGDFLKQQMQW
jgi:lysophospholipase L1-like esterase